MPALITVSVNDRQVRSMLDHMHSRLRNMGPFYKNVGELMVSETKEIIFPSQADPETGRPWQKLRPSTLARKKRRTILQESGQLRESIRYQADGSGVRWGTNKIYGAIHFFGGKTRPHVIRPVRKKALAWPGASHPARLVHHPGSTMPARRFLGVGPRQRERILEIAEDFLKKGAA